MMPESSGGCSGSVAAARGIPCLPNDLSILRGWLRFRPGCFPGARPLFRFYAPFTRHGRGFFCTRSPPPRLFGFLTPLLLAQISPELFIGKTAAQSGSSNRKCSCDLDRPLARCHMPRTFVQRISIRKRKPTARCITFTRHKYLFR
jgi:hypothetical protein